MCRLDGRLVIYNKLHTLSIPQPCITYSYLVSKAAVKLKLRLSPDSTPVHDHEKVATGCRSFMADLMGVFSQLPRSK